jgi:hypothetical protein
MQVSIGANLLTPQISGRIKTKIVLLVQLLGMPDLDRPEIRDLTY